MSTGSGSTMTTQIVAVDKNSKDCATGLTLQFTANVPLHNRDIHVLVSSRGQVQLWQSKPALTTTTQSQNTYINSKTINVSLIADSKNIIGAGARLIVFSVNKSGEVLSNGVELNQLTTCLANDDTQVRFNVDEVQPGHTVDLVMNTTGRNAKCAVSAIDAGLNAPEDGNSKTVEIKRQVLQKIVSLQNEVYLSEVQLYTTSYISYLRNRNEIVYKQNKVINKNKKLKLIKKQIKERVRQFFPETWLWSSFRLNTNQQQHRMRVTAPDSITSWLTNMACVSNSGLGVSPTAKPVVFQPFFLKLAMPYSAVRGERVRLPVSVHSYSSACYQVRSMQHAFLLHS